MARLNAAWLDFVARGKAWYHFWQDDAPSTGGRTASVAVTLDDASAVASATLKIAAVVSLTLADASAAATGSLKLQGVVSATLADATLTATSALRIAGATNVALADATVTASGQVRLAGAVAVTLDDAAVATAADLALAAAAAVTLQDASVTAQGALQIKGATALTLQDASVVATGVNGTAPIQGVVSLTLQDASVVATGGLALAGAVSLSLQDATCAATGTLRIRGAVATTLADAAVLALGTLALKGAVDVILDDAVAAALGIHPGSLSFVPGRFTLLVPWRDRLTTPQRSRVVMVEDCLRTISASLHVRALFVRARVRVLSEPGAFAMSTTTRLPAFSGEKRTAEVDVFAFDFKTQLDVGETINTPTWAFAVAADSPSAEAPVTLTTSGPSTISGSKVLQKLAAGASGVKYVVTCRVATSAGRTLEGAATLLVEDGDN